MDEKFMLKKLKYVTILFIYIISFFCIINISPLIDANSGSFLFVGGSGKGNFTNIQESIDNSVENDIIRVYAGNYSENIIINKSIVLIGSDKNNVTIYGNNGLYSILIKSSNVSISGFTIKNSKAGLLISGSDYKYCNVNNCIFTRHSEAIRIINSSNHKINNNIIMKNHNLGIVLYNSNLNELFNNTFIENNKVIYLGRWSNYNTISKNNLSGYNYGIHLDYSFYNEVINNSISNGDFGIYLTSSKNNTVTYNYIYNNDQIGIYTSNSDENIFSPNIFLNNHQDMSKKARPPDIKTPGFEVILVLIAIFFITFVKKN
jgi:parallel beta-helix repeat protein